MSVINARTGAERVSTAAAMAAVAAGLVCISGLSRKDEEISEPWQRLLELIKLAGVHVGWTATDLLDLKKYVQFTPSSVQVLALLVHCPIKHELMYNICILCCLLKSGGSVAANTKCAPPDTQADGRRASQVPAGGLLRPFTALLPRHGSLCVENETASRSRY